MDLFDLWFLGVALAMDCFTVSIVCGVTLRRTVWSIAIKTALLFGIFQALMPLLGWLGTFYLNNYIKPFDHWIAFGLLAFLGGKMIWGSFQEETDHQFKPDSLRMQLALAVATSIDALAVGISFACMGYDTIGSLAVPLPIIGLCSFAFSIAGNQLGVKFGAKVCSNIKPELLGGLILIGIGIKVLYTHLSEEGISNWIPFH